MRKTRIFDLIFLVGVEIWATVQKKKIKSNWYALNFESVGAYLD